MIEREIVIKNVKCPVCKRDYTYKFAIDKTSVHAASAIGMHFLSIICLNCSIYIFYTIFVGLQFFLLVILFAATLVAVDKSIVWLVKNAFIRIARDVLIVKEFTFILICMNSNCKKTFEAKIPLHVRKGNYNNFTAAQVEA